MIIDLPRRHEFTDAQITDDLNERETEIATHNKYGRAFTRDYWSPHIWYWQRIVVPRYAGIPNVVAVEVGSLEGRSAIWIAENVCTGPGECLTCIDPWYDPVIAELAMHNFRRTPAMPRITRLWLESDDALTRIRKASVDLIYVDGAHDAESVCMDAALSWRLLKPSGLLVFDDYGIPDVRRAVDAFLSVNKKAHVLWADWQVFVEKKT